MLGLESFVVFFRVLSPVLLTYMAWIVWRTPYQERVNRLLAAFLAVLAFGFWTEVLWDIFRGLQPEAEQGLRAVQDIAGYIDPPLLLAFAIVLSGRGRPRVMHGLIAIFTVLGATLFYAAQTRTLIDRAWFPLWHNLYVNATYLAVFGLVWASYASESRRFRARQLHFLTLGVGFAALSRMSAFFIQGGPRALRQDTFEAQVGASLVLALGTLALVTLVIAVRQALEARPYGRIVKVAWLLGALVLGFFSFWYLMLRWTDPTALQPLAAYYFNFRWVLFAAIVGYGVLRFQLFDFELRSRQVIALFGVTVAAIGVAIAAGLALEGAGLGLLPARLGGLAAAAAVGAPTFIVLHRRAGAAPGDDDAFQRRRLEIYQATLEYALQKTQWSDEERRFVDTLREVFEVTPEEHQAVIEGLTSRDDPTPHSSSRPTSG